MNKQKQLTTYSKNIQNIVLLLNNIHVINKTLESIEKGLSICSQLKIVTIQIEVRLTDKMLEKLAQAISKCQLCEKIVIISQKCGDYQPLLQQFFEKLTHLKYLIKFEAKIEFKVAKSNSLDTFFTQLQYLTKLSCLQQIDIQFKFSDDINILSYHKIITHLFQGLKILSKLHYIRVNFGDFECFKMNILSELKEMFDQYPKILYKVKSLAHIDVNFRPYDFIYGEDMYE